ncbi:MAG: GTPase [Bacteroidia bacterium]|nr:GTPase [Bacteroidia bacterium]
MVSEQSSILLFIYNANSGLGNAMLDSAHKIVDPATYACSLCQLTYGTFREKKRWKNFREQFHLPMTFLHKDEFFKAFKSIDQAAIELPIIYKVENESLEILVEASELNKLKNESELIDMIKDRVPAI